MAILVSNHCADHDTPPSEKPEVIPLETTATLGSTAPLQGSAIDAEAERKLLRKLDIRIVPPLLLLFTLSFLDRTNIGNSKIQGMTTDLNMIGTDYNIALFIFYISYIPCEVPSNIILKKIAPSKWLCGIMICWGIVTIGEGLVQNFASLVVLRLILGIFEAGLVPGCIYLISMYYKRYELQRRLTVFFSGSIIAGAFGGLFAYAIANMKGVAGYNAWRWIFIIEGLITCVVAILSLYFVVDWPETAKFLSPTERALLLARLKQDDISPSAGFNNNAAVVTSVDEGSHLTHPARMDHLNKRSARRIFLDWKIWCAVVMYCGVVNTGTATSFFIPTIINEMGYTAQASQVRSIPIFVVAAVMSLGTAWISDRTQHRYGFTMLGVLVGTIGYVILLCQEYNGGLSNGVKYMACFFIVSGGYMTQPITWVWLNNNLSGHYKRSIGTALQIGVGNVGGITASTIFVQWQAPTYSIGYGVSLALLLMCGMACTVFYFGLKRENKRREMGGADYMMTDEERLEGNMGDDWPGFRFVT